MKKIILALTVLSTIAFAQVQPQPQVPASLKNVMKEMSLKLKSIAAQSTDASKNSSSEQLANDLVFAVTNAKNFIPDTATDQASKDMFLKMIDETIDLSKQLADAFHQNDNAKAADILAKLSQEKKDGHTRFKN